MILLFGTLLALLTGLYLYLASQKSKPLPLTVHLESVIGIEASTGIYEEAISYAVKNLAIELDINQENYDLTLEDYKAIVEAAASKFGDCHQYRLYALEPRLYSCFTCTSRQTVVLNAGQTYKIGQTCGTEKTRYNSGLPEPGLKYFIEVEGNIFEVMVAEYVKLVLFQFSIERKVIIKNNNLSDEEMVLPPGNKILK